MGRLQDAEVLDRPLNIEVRWTTGITTAGVGREQRKGHFVIPERMAGAKVEALHRDPLTLCAMADLMRDLGLPPLLNSARWDLVLPTPQERLRLAPLPAAVRAIRRESDRRGATSL